jgi:hypothetical protein
MKMETTMTISATNFKVSREPEQKALWREYYYQLNCFRAASEAQDAYWANHHADAMEAARIRALRFKRETEQLAYREPEGLPVKTVTGTGRRLKKRELAEIGKALPKVAA